MFLCQYYFKTNKYNMEMLVNLSRKYVCFVLSYKWIVKLHQLAFFSVQVLFVQHPTELRLHRNGPCQVGIWNERNMCEKNSAERVAQWVGVFIFFVQGLGTNYIM
jgi:hypothetical protein